MTALCLCMFYHKADMKLLNLLYLDWYDMREIGNKEAKIYCCFVDVNIIEKIYDKMEV